MIEVELPDGRVIEVDAENPQQAAKAAKVYLSKREPSFFQKAKDVFTGNDRKTATSDKTPEIGSETGIADFLGPRASVAQKALASAGFTSTFDPQGQFNILKANTPDALVMDKDEKGNIYAVRVDPETGEGHKVILNRPGVSKLDAAQTVAQVGAFFPAGKAAQAATIGAKAIPAASTIGQAAARVGVASGLTQAGLSGMTQAAGRDASGGEIAGEIAIAGTLGAGFEAIGQKVAQVFKARGLAKQMRETGITDELREEVKRIVIPLGVNADDVTDDFIRSFSVAPDARLPMEREFGTQLTRGGRSLDPQQLNFEDSARAGALGERAQTAYVTNERGQLGDLNRAQLQIASEIGGTETLFDNQLTAQNVMNRVRGAESTARDAERQAYEGVADAGLNTDLYKGLLNRARLSVQSTDYPKNPEHASTRSALDFLRTKLADIESVMGSKKLARQMQGRTIPIKEVEGIRRQLNAFKTDAANNTDRRNMQQIVQTFDDYLDNDVVRALMDGDSNAIQQYKDARGLTREYFRKFGERPTLTRSGNFIPDRPGKFIEKIIFSDPTDEEVANTLFSAAALSNKASSNMALRFREVLGQGSAEWNQVRQAAFRNMIGFKTEMAETVISPRKSASGIKKALENDSLMQVLYTPEELGKMRRFVGLLERIDPNMGNLTSRIGSGSGKNAMGSLMQTIKTFLPGLVTGNAITITAAGLTQARTFTNAAKTREAFRPFGAIIGTAVKGVPTTGAATGAAIVPTRKAIGD